MANEEKKIICAYPVLDKLSKFAIFHKIVRARIKAFFISRVFVFTPCVVYLYFLLFLTFRSHSIVKPVIVLHFLAFRFIVCTESMVL